MRYLLAAWLLALMPPTENKLPVPEPPTQVCAVQPNAKAAPAAITAFVADVDAVSPGQTFRLGVELSVQPGWHIYAQDPGQIGKGTSVSLTLPPGFSEMTQQWPQALVEKQDGFTINAYEGKIFVVIPVAAPKQLTAGTITINAEVGWLACKDSCVPGRHQLTLVLPVATPGVTPSAANAARFPNASAGVLDGDLHPRDVTGEHFATVSLWWSLLLAFAGGMLLNFMPCVLPVLSLKIMGFVRQAHEKRSVVFKLGLAYTAGTLAAFLSLAALVIALKAAGQTVGWGFQFQHPAFLLAMTALTTVMALGLFGLFDITFYGGAQELDSLARKEGPLGAFFLGILATLLSTPCTAPMLGTALGFALSQPAWVILAIFTAIALGLSAPYLLLSANPGWLRWIPRPGAWMEWFKRLMGMIMLASAGWLLWVMWNGFGNALALGAGGFCLAVAVSTWLVCRYQYADKRARTWSWLGALTLCTAVYLTLVQPVMFNRVEAKAQGAEQLVAEPFSPEALSKHLAQGQLVFIDFTADWCLTCKVNESVVLRSTEVQQAFKSMNVAVLRADWTDGNEALTKLIAKFGRSGVPLYVVFSPDKPDRPIVLPEVITRQLVIDALKTASGKK